MISGFWSADLKSHWKSIWLGYLLITWRLEWEDADWWAIRDLKFSWRPEG
jgi:hypothetical protein